MVVEPVAGDSDDKRGQLCGLSQLAPAQAAEGIDHYVLKQVGSNIGIAGASQQHCLDGPQVARGKRLLRVMIAADDGPYQPLILMRGVLGQRAWFVAMIAAHLLFDSTPSESCHFLIEVRVRLRGGKGVSVLFYTVLVRAEGVQTLRGGKR